MDLAGDAAILALILVAIMAIVGVFVVVYVGSQMVNEVIRTHISVLQKRGLAKDFIVADLEEDGTTVNGVVNVMHDAEDEDDDQDDHAKNNGIHNNNDGKRYSALKTNDVTDTAVVSGAAGDTTATTQSHSLHRDEDLEAAATVALTPMPSAPQMVSLSSGSSTLRRRNHRSNLSESQRSELIRLGLVCTDEEVYQNANGSVDSDSSYPNSRSSSLDGYGASSRGSEMTQRVSNTNASRRQRSK